MTNKKLTRVDLYVFCNQLNMMGVRFLSAYLKSKNIDVRLIYTLAPADRFSYEIYSDELLNKIVKFSEQADVVGFSITSNYFLEAVKLTAKFKKNSQVPVVWGGVHPTLEVDDCLNYTDYVIRGEGEKAFHEFIEKYMANENLDDIGNLAYKRNGEIVKTPLKSLIGNLNDLPLPDTDFTSHYLTEDDQILKVNHSLMKKHMLTFSNKARVTYNVSTTRGCPHSCTYCVNFAYKELYGNRGYVRKRSIESIIQEISTVVKKYPFIDYIFFADETLFVNKRDFIKQLAEEYKEKIGLLSKIEFSPQTFNEEKLAHMVEAGAVELHLGVESGSDSTNYEIYKRKYPAEKIKKIINTIYKYRAKLEVVHLHILICNPFEDQANTKDTFKFIIDVPNYFDIRFFPLVFFPGTELLRKAEELQIIDRKNRDKDIYLHNWNENDALSHADYYTICMKFLYFLKKEININKFFSLAFFHFFAFPPIKLLLDNKVMKSVLVKGYRFSYYSSRVFRHLKKGTLISKVKQLKYKPT